MAQPRNVNLDENVVTGDEVNEAQGEEVSSPAENRLPDDVANGATVTRERGKQMAQWYFNKTLGVPRFVAQWRRHYGDASDDMDHGAFHSFCVFRVTVLM